MLLLSLERLHFVAVFALTQIHQRYLASISRGAFAVSTQHIQQADINIIRPFISSGCVSHFQKEAGISNLGGTQLVPIHLLSSGSHYSAEAGYTNTACLASACSTDSLNNMKRNQMGGKIPLEELIWSQTQVPDGKSFPRLVSIDPISLLCCHGDGCRESTGHFCRLSTKRTVLSVVGDVSSLAPSLLRNRRPCDETVGETSSFHWTPRALF